MSDRALPSGPVYGSWDEAMSDPNLDLSKPWYVAPPPVDGSDTCAGWPEGWVEIGATEDYEHPTA